MFELFMRLIKFLFPILRTAVLQVAADEINKKAYPSGKGKLHFDYSKLNQERRLLSDPFAPTAADRREFEANGGRIGKNPFVIDEEPVTDLNAYDRAYTERTGKEIDRPVVMGIEVSGKDMQDRQRKLWDFFTTVLDDERYPEIVGFWIAEDERHFGSPDLDSAIFVPKGEQVFWASVKDDRIANGEGMNGKKL